jgi:hypothetical protein
MAAFVQVIDFETTKPEEMNALMNAWESETKGMRRMSVKGLLTHDREHKNHYMEIVEFPSYEIAMENNEKPSTQKFAGRMQELCSSGPRFVNLDVERRDSW